MPNIQHPYRWTLAWSEGQIQSLQSSTSLQPTMSATQFAQQRTTALQNIARVTANDLLRQAPSGIRDIRQQEILDIETFIQTGSHRKDKYISTEGGLYVCGSPIDNEPIVFQIKDGTIRAHEQRVRHLKSLLKTLAKREGLKIEYVDEPLETEGELKRITYYAFKHREEVDDSALLTARPASGQHQDPVPDPRMGAESHCECDQFCELHMSHGCGCMDMSEEF